MVISHVNKFIYIKPTKVAGTSTQLYLAPLCSNNDIVTDTACDKKYHKGINSNQHRPHLPASGIKLLVGDADFATYFKFMNVRNPWDRTVSAFWHDHGPLGHEDYANDSFVKSIQNSISKHKLEHTIKEKFTEWIYTERLPAPLHSWHSVGGESVLDDVIRYEALEQDTRRILTKLRLTIHKDVPYPKEKADYRKLKCSYTNYYNDSTCEYIAKKYYRDIMSFGYTFK